MTTYKYEPFINQVIISHVWDFSVHPLVNILEIGHDFEEVHVFEYMKKHELHSILCLYK